MASGSATEVPPNFCTTIGKALGVRGQGLVVGGTDSIYIRKGSAGRSGERLRLFTLAIECGDVISTSWLRQSLNRRDELEEARKLKCDVIIHAPHDIPRLCETLTRVVQG